MKRALKMMAIAVSVLAALPAAAEANPITLSFASQLTASPSNIPGTVAGDPFNIAIVVDNGGASVLSQSWNLADFVSATVTIGGTYSAFTTTANGGFSATTNSLGQVASIALSSTIGTDSLGTFVWLIVNSGNPVMFSGSSAATPTVRTLPSNFVAAAVPDPASTFGLLGFVCAGLATANRWRGRA